jgi:hypothetical protein
MKTAVEQLIHELNLIEKIQINGKDVIQIELNKLDVILDKAKEMEKEQIVKAWWESPTMGIYCSSEEYYNETFKQQ